MAKRTLTEIEDAIVTALQPLQASLKVKTLAPYGGELDADSVKESVKFWPCLLVSFQGSSVEDLGQRKIEHLRFVIVTGDLNQTDAAKARRGGSANPGTYALLEACRGLLEGVQLLPELMLTESMGASSSVQFGGVSLYAARFLIKQPYLVTLQGYPS
jgi:phage gp37-like protein